MINRSSTPINARSMARHGWRGVALNATIAAMEFKVLGPLEVIGPRGRIKIGSGLQRAILALLVLHVGETVSTDPPHR